MHLHRYDILLKLVRLFLFFHLFGFSSPLRPRWELMQYYLLELGRRWSRACRWTCYRCSCPCPIRWRPWSPTCCASGSRSPFRLWRRPVSVENLRDSRCGTRRRSPEGWGSACVHRMLSKIEETKKKQRDCILNLPIRADKREGTIIAGRSGCSCARDGQAYVTTQLLSYSRDLLIP